MTWAAIVRSLDMRRRLAWPRVAGMARYASPYHFGVVNRHHRFPNRATAMTSPARTGRIDVVGRLARCRFSVMTRTAIANHFDVIDPHYRLESERVVAFLAHIAGFDMSRCFSRCGRCSPAMT